MKATTTGTTSTVTVKLSLNELSITKLALQELRANLKKELDETSDDINRLHITNDISEVADLTLRTIDAIHRFEKKFGR